ncbi:GIY-YIG nuclease family protein [Lysobacter sp. CA199]|uniref:GIY-YIG nuclease family protein n=1 Tax=Lysobacter sp. CA199 TaxID=3455608 RepID=UPI003F8D102A
MSVESMSSIEPTSPMAKRCLYIAVPTNATQFKVGIAHRPMERLRGLGLVALDLNYSAVVEGPAPAIAQLERVLHFELDAWRKPIPDRRAGFTEWFDRSGLGPALDAIARLLESHKHLELRRVSWDELESKSPTAKGDSELSPQTRRAARQAQRRLEWTKTIERTAQRALAHLDHLQMMIEFAVTRGRGVALGQGGELVIGFDGLTESDRHWLHDWNARQEPVGCVEIYHFLFVLSIDKVGTLVEICFTKTPPNELMTTLHEQGVAKSLPVAVKAYDALNRFFDAFHRRMAAMPAVEYRNLNSKLRELSDESSASPMNSRTGLPPDQ